MQSLSLKSTCSFQKCLIRLLHPCMKVKQKNFSVKMSQIVNLEDVGCPICLEILVEPITMPCKHTICKVGVPLNIYHLSVSVKYFDLRDNFQECFEKTIELANTVCPMCKKRISIWCRKAKKVENLIDVRLWDKIKNQFPDLVTWQLISKKIFFTFLRILSDILWSFRFRFQLV